jgi:hypothetical protein
MATGRLNYGGVGIQLGTGNTTLYTVPSGYYAVCNVSYTNTTSTSKTVTLALASTTSPSANEIIESQTTIVGYGVFERTGLVLQAGYSLVGTASAGSAINATVYGFETATS